MSMKQIIPLFVVLYSLIGSSSTSPTRREDLFNINVVHMNDFHARFDETNNEGGTCKSDGCIGGFSRLFNKITNVLKENPESVLLNAGDNFQGTLWYSLFKWNVTQYFLNQLPFDAFVLGNHEFDDGIDGVVPFIKSLKAPVVVSNIDDSLEPSIQGLYTKSVVIERGGKKIGIIGVLTSATSQISNVGKLKFYLESTSVNAEAERLVREEGVFTNIVLSHSGYDLEQVMAQNATNKISLIVGGHSHTFLDSDEPPIGVDTPGGPYPTIVKRDGDNKTVLVVQAGAYCKYLGNLKVFYDENGDVVDYQGGPIFLDHNSPKDDKMDDELEPWKKAVEDVGNEVMGETIVELSNKDCYISECMLGNFITDAYVDSYTTLGGDSWTYASIAITNAGSLRTSLPIGNVTYNDVVNSQPFGDTVDVGEIQGKYIKDMFEYSMQTPYYYGREEVNIKLIQVSGLHIVLNISESEGQRVKSIKVRCRDCEIPVYEDLDLNKTYRIITPSFLTNGGDGLTVLSDNLQNVVTGPFDMDVFRNYFKTKSPIFEEIGGRIKIVAPEKIKSRRVHT